MRRYTTVLVMFVAPMLLVAQIHSDRTTIYPSAIYPGENIITITNDAGIDRVSYTASSQTHVTVPPITGCPTRINLRVRVDDATTNESVDLTVTNCRGPFATTTLHAQNWTIRKEYTGKVTVGRDTCLHCEIITTDMRTVDSIVVNNPHFRVSMPTTSGPWTAEGSDFKYLVCYKPTEPENIHEMIRIYIRRDEPNGGLSEYVIEKPVTAIAVPPPPPKPPTPPRPEDTLPPLEDPTTFRNIAMPTAEPLDAGAFFAGNYDVAGWIAGYGASSRLTLLLGSVAVPDFISRLLVVTAGAKYEFLDADKFKAAVGFQYAFSSTIESDISTAAPYAVVSYGDRRNRISVAAGYSWKHHATSTGEFDRRAYIVSLGGDVTIRRGMKLAAEGYIIESSGVLPAAVTVRWFGEHYAFDAGLGVDLSGVATVKGTGSLSGEATNLHLAPVLSFLWKW